MKQSSLTRRLFAGAAGLMIGMAGLVALATPAQATGDHQRHIKTPSAVDFSDECDGTWVFIHTGTFLPTYDWTVAADGEEFAALQLAKGESDSVFVPTEAGTSIEVDFASSPGGWPATWTWTEPAEGCEEPEVPEEPEEPEVPEEPELSGFVNVEFDCESVFITIQNDSEVDVTFSVVPSDGDAVEVTVGAGETSEEVTVPVSVGLILDLQVDGESVLEDGPFEFTEEDLEGCDEGEGGELPKTGASTGLIALGAVALLALGGGLFLVARRRRVTFTA